MFLGKFEKVIFRGLELYYAPSPMRNKGALATEQDIINFKPGYGAVNGDVIWKDNKVIGKRDEIQFTGEFEDMYLTAEGIKMFKFIDFTNRPESIN